MKKIIFAIALLILTAPTFACDETCKRQQAEQKTGEKLAGYLSWQFCDETKESFLTLAMPSLEKYNEQNNNGMTEGTRRKAAMRNTRIYINNQKDWLAECDHYLEVTHKGHIFKDKKTTKKIFGDMESVSSELLAQMKGAIYTDGNTGLDTSNQVSAEKFEALFTSIRMHVDKANLRGGDLYVTR
jgi:hypothetical protein